MEQAQEQPDPRVGMLLLGKYRVVRKIGEGGMGAVYEARHEGVGRRVAVKCLHARFAADPHVVARFHREALASNAVQNEHIVDVYDMDRFPDGSPFLAMEFLEGRELAAVLKHDGPLPASRVVHVMSQVCRALSAAHAKGIVHRDLKPENIFLVRRGSEEEFVKILDFGISKMKEHAEALAGGLTKTGMAMGPPFYMAPEQAQGLRDVDGRADVYALGVILFEALTGGLPFNAESYPALMVKILLEPPPRLNAYRPDLPVALEGVVERALAKKPEERFQTMAELSAALAPFAHITGAKVVSVRPPGSVPSTPTPAPDGSGTAPYYGGPPAADSVAPPAALGGTAPAWSNTLAPSVPTRGRAPVLVGAVALGVALVSGVGFVVYPRTPHGVDTQAAMRTTPAPPLVPAVPVPIAPAPIPTPTAPREVQVTITTDPATASVFIDGEQYPAGTTFSRERALRSSRVRVDAPGYQSVVQVAVFDRDRELTYTLTRGRGTRELAAVRDPGESTAPGASTHPSPTATAAPPTSPGAPSEQVHPVAPPPPIEPHAPSATPPTPGPGPTDPSITGGNLRGQFQ